MRTGIFTTAMALLLGATETASAQTYVAFDVPLNLTLVSPDIEKVRVTCGVASEGLVLPSAFINPWSTLLSTSLPAVGGRQEMWIVGGQLVMTAKVVIPILADFLQDPIGKTASYACMMDGYSKSLQKWSNFSEQSTEQPFRLKVTPEAIQGTFVW